MHYICRSDIMQGKVVTGKSKTHNPLNKNEGYKPFPEVSTC